LNPARLSAHLRQFGRIAYFLHLIAQLARTSRSQAHSSLVSPLKETRRCTSEQRKEREPPPTTCTRRHENC
jgi:hypothetical protein